MISRGAQRCVLHAGGRAAVAVACLKGCAVLAGSSGSNELLPSNVSCAVSSTSPRGPDTTASTGLVSTFSVTCALVLPPLDSVAVKLKVSASPPATPGTGPWQGEGAAGGGAVGTAGG